MVDHGWHTGLVIRRGDIPAGFWPESADFPSADSLEVGWGDRDYYQSAVPGVWLTLKAAFWPTASVLHVVGVRGSVAGRFGGFEIVRLELTESRLAGLMAYIDHSFARHDGVRARPIGPGWSGYGLFYPARGAFHLFNTCNGWTADALDAAGYPMGPLRPVTSGQLMAKVRRFAEPPGRDAASSR